MDDKNKREQLRSMLAYSLLGEEIPVHARNEHHRFDFNEAYSYTKSKDQISELLTIFDLYWATTKSF